MFQVFHQQNLLLPESSAVVEPCVLPIIKIEPLTGTKKKRGRPSLKNATTKASSSKEISPEIKLHQYKTLAAKVKKNLSEDANKDSKLDGTDSKINDNQKQKSLEIISTGIGDFSSQKLSSLMNNERSKKRRFVAVNEFVVKEEQKNIEIHHFDPIGNNSFFLHTTSRGSNS